MRTQSHADFTVMLETIRRNVVVLHDFFVDRIVQLTSFGRLAGAMKRKARQGGGSIHGVRQYEIKGGNAVNLAYALGRLDVPTRLITLADDFTEPILRRCFQALKNVELSVRAGKPGYTVSFEYPAARRRVNVMLGDPGDVARFGWQQMKPDDLHNIQQASMVALVNWAANYEQGTALAQEVFAYAKKGEVRTFFDPADMTVRADDFRVVIRSILTAGLVDVLSVNENEARALARLVGATPLPAVYDERDIVRGAKTLASNLSLCLDLHTPRGSASSAGSDVSFAPTFKVQERFLTGAGDVWDAADILGHLVGAEPQPRLLFANACAALFVSSEDLQPPHRQRVVEFLQERTGAVR